MDPEQNSSNFVLTPILATSKISILVLIRGYCYQKVPSKSIPPILSTLVELIEADKSDQINQETDIVSVFFPSLNEVLDLVSKSIRSFFNNLSAGNGQEIEDDIKHIHRYLLNTIWSLTDFESFYSFLLESSKLLVDPSSVSAHLKDVSNSAITKKPSKLLFCSSFLGRFVSSIALATEILMFEEGIKIWKAFCEYREETKQTWKLLNDNSNASVLSLLKEKRETEDTKIFEEQVLSQASPFQQSSSPNVFSQIDLTGLFEFQVSKLQTNSTPLPLSLKKIIKSMSQSQRSIVPSSYYIEYLECWKKGDYDGSFNALHRYFDYMMSSKKHLFYHYALLSLATLHASFGADNEALRAIDEAILVARENKDLDCLNYLLTWLFDFLKSKPYIRINNQNQPSRSQILRFLKLKTKETKNPLLQSLSFQYEAIFQILEGSPLIRINENITRAFYILLNLDSSNNTKNTLVRACQLNISVWSRVGIPALANIYLDVALESIGYENSFFEVIEINLRKASRMYESGQINEAFELLKSYEKTVYKETSLLRSWKVRILILEIDLWLKKCRHNLALILLKKLETQAAEINDQDLSYEVMYYKSYYHLKVKNINESVHIITSQITAMKSSENYYNNFWFIQFQILYAQILADHSSSPERALSILLNALFTAHSSSILTLLSRGLIVLCSLLLKMDPENSTSDVKKLLSCGMPRILEVGNLSITSRAYYLLAKVNLMELISQQNELTDNEIKCKFNDILEYLEVSISGFKMLYDLDNLMEAFEIEKALAEFSGHLELVEHSNQAIRKLDITIEQEQISGMA